MILFTGCASTLAPHNDRLARFDPDYGYRFTNAPRADRSDDVLIALSFSGGGTRAAALSYGVLEELARTRVSVSGRAQRLLDLVRSISAVSGGSYTAAYFGLFGDRIFEDFEPRFLTRDVQSAIAQSLFSPVNLFRMTSPFFGRSDVTAEYLDRTLFEGKTFGDLLARTRQRASPFIEINATDMARGSPFVFSQEMFDLLCSDLSSYSVARAVTSSSAVPVIFSPITLKNYAGSCGYPKPAQFDAALQVRQSSLRRYSIANDLASYLDSDRRRYVHLLDGGLSDNLGLRGGLDRLQLSDAGEIASAYQIENVRRFVQIVVNAQARPDLPDVDQSAEVPTFSAIAFAVANTADRYSVETLALLRTTMRSFIEAHKAERRRRNIPDADDVEGYIVEVNFELLSDAAERAYFNNLPTTFSLPPEAIDRLREVAGRLLRQSPDLHRLLGELR